MVEKSPTHKADINIIFLIEWIEKKCGPKSAF